MYQMDRKLEVDEVYKLLLVSDPLPPPRASCERGGGGGGSRQRRCPTASLTLAGGGRGGGVWDPKVCVPKMARSDVPSGKFVFFPAMVTLVMGGGLGGSPPPPFGF